MKLLPRSLFWRLMLILVLGLILAQIIGSMILLRDRNNVLQQNLGQHLIDRVTTVVKLVDRMSTAERWRTIQAFDSPEFRVAISDRPNPPAENAISPPHMVALLKRKLPEHSQVRVTILPGDSVSENQRNRRRDHRIARVAGDHKPPRFWRNRHMGFQAQVQISSGEWIIFNRPIPGDFNSRRVNALTYLAILVLSIVLLSFIAVRYVTRPLGILANAADDLGRNIQSPPLDESGPAEVTAAARAFNTMQQRLRRYIEDRGEILAAVSHDLKTPITRMRLRTEMLAQDDAKEKFTQDLNEMEQMVGATLDFMRGTESSEAPVPIEIMALLEALLDDMNDLGCKIKLEPAELRPYIGRPLLLKRCLTNLIENAVRYGGETSVRLAQTNEELQIIIADNGPGIPEAERERVFRPFVRGESSRNRNTGGTGLGLSIARNIARAHGGELILRAGKNEVGLEAVVTLPIVSS